MKKLLSVWHGDTNIATYETDGGIYDNSDLYALDNMFDDESSSSIWHSHDNTWNTVFSLTINFLSPIDFQHLKIMKRPYNEHPNYATAWLNVCLVLDNDEANQLCTDEQKGFSDSDNENVIWTMPKNAVSIVELVFRDTGTYGNGASGGAMVRDLKIFYKEIPGKFYPRVNIT